MSEKAVLGVAVYGCDDATRFNIEATLEEAQFLGRVAAASNEASDYGCQPTLEIVAAHPEDTADASEQRQFAAQLLGVSMEEEDGTVLDDGVYRLSLYVTDPDRSFASALGKTVTVAEAVES